MQSLYMVRIYSRIPNCRSPDLDPLHLSFADVADILAVNIGAEMLKVVPGRISTEVRGKHQCGTLLLSLDGPYLHPPRAHPSCWLPHAIEVPNARVDMDSWRA